MATLPVINSFTGDYRWASNFWAVVIKLDDQVFPSVENAYQAAKTLNLDERAQFMDITPGKAKRLGKTVQLRNDWENVKLPIMQSLLMQKFQVEYLKKLLLDTGDVELIEGNDWGDTFWGVYNGVGENHLGKLLMYIRDRVL